MSQNVIELNGKRYDAITGAYLGKSSVIPKHIMQAHGRTIDGFIRPSHTSHKPVEEARVHKPAVQHHTAPKPVQHQTAAKETVAPKRPHHPAKPAGAHQPERAKTLMRRAVHKPEVSIKPAIKPQAPAEMTSKIPATMMRKHSAQQVDQHRLERAVRMVRHQAVRRFQPTGRALGPTHSISVPVPVIAVQPTPLQYATPQLEKHTDIFEKAIAHANSHRQPAHKPVRHRARRRLVNTLATVAAFLVIGGFVGYLNLPNIEMRVASVQAGFRASMPAYTPTGYALEGSVQRSGGTVSLSFRSGDSQYTVTQQASDWNSQTLLDNTLALSNPHQTVQKNGQTIYIYGNGANASWVNGGIRYDIAGNAQLSTEDVAAIATSL